MLSQRPPKSPQMRAGDRQDSSPWLLPTASVPPARVRSSWVPPRASPGQCHCCATCSLPTQQRPELNISAAAELLPQELQETTFLEGVAVFLVQSKGLAPSKMSTPIARSRSCCSLA